MRPKKINHDAEVIIVGGGLAGLTLAACLGAQKIRTLCLERVVGNPAAHDVRTTAIAAGPKNLLASCGVWRDLAAEACPIKSIRIADQDSPHTLDFHHDEVGAEPFGFIVNNGSLRASLTKRLQKLTKYVEIIAPAVMQDLALAQDQATVTLQDGRSFAAQLVVGADGRSSPCRELAGIDSYGWDYQQTAFVCTIRHALPHNHVAVEHFLGEGPLATLPVSDLPKAVNGLRHRSSVVWTVSAATAEYLQALAPAAFTDELAKLVGGWCGAIALESDFQTYPLQLQHARAYTAPRLALINEAAHRIHPVAGQGLNLGMRDIENLVQLISRDAALGLDLGNADLLKNYARSRQRDTLQMVIATDGLVRLFSNNQPVLRQLRQWGFSLVQQNGMARRFFMKTAMGLP